jgi:drug/metabolite transporter (DMT)-like permease
MAVKVTGVKGVLLGVAIGLGLGLYATFNVPAQFQTESYRCLGILFGGLIGAVAGCLLWWIDWRRRPASPKAWLSAMMTEDQKTEKK